MKTETNITSNTRDAEWLLPTDDSETPDFYNVAEINKERLSAIAKKYGVTNEFMLDLDVLLTEFRDAVHNDLRDIWKRLDAIDR